MTPRPIHTSTTHLAELPGGQTLRAYTLEAEGGIKAVILNYGGILHELWVPDQNGEPADILLGQKTPTLYVEENDVYFGALIGPFGNRISRGCFSLDGVPYEVAVNAPPHQLHGGPNGFHTKWWTGGFADDHSLRLRTSCPHGEDGFPGGREVHVTFRLTPEGGLRYEFEVTTDRPTVLNLTAHPYFNLAGQAAGSLAGHTMQCIADRYVEVDAAGIPTGNLPPVDGTPFDFRADSPIAPRLNADHPQIRQANGFDHTLAFPEERNPSAPVARMRDNESGRCMEIYTSEPGVQFYTGNTLPQTPRTKAPYGPHAGFCLETQHFPDSPNHPAFPSTAVRPGEVFRTFTELRFL
ncbi:MAG: galactose mutarotase [Opitutales bacterium]|nr:galactose mutarotase [Opitutales bacterium]